MFVVNRNALLWLAILLRLALPFVAWFLGATFYPRTESHILKGAILVMVYTAVRDIFNLWERRPRLWRWTR